MSTQPTPPVTGPWIDPADFGFSPDADGITNARALQQAVAGGGTVQVCRPGIYDLAHTVYLDSDTTLIFGSGVWIRKVALQGAFSHVLLNRGALQRTCNHAIAVHGMRLMVNGVDACTHEIFGLRGQLAFFHVRDLHLSGFRCHDLGAQQYAIHICSFEDIHLRDLVIHGRKDGVHLGRGRRFTIRDGVFCTYDDAIALNAHDYDTGNPELGWIEHGVIENCHDLSAEETTGFFCRILAGGWCDWQAGMLVQKSDTVVSHGRLYRVRAEPDGRQYCSLAPPQHAQGAQVLDGITWHMVQEDMTHTAGVRHVVFRDIVLAKPRTAFSIHFDSDRYSRSYYPGAQRPQQQNLLFDHVTVVHDQPTDLLAINTPVDAITLRHARLRRNPIRFHGQADLHGELPTQLSLIGCTFDARGASPLLHNEVADKSISLHASASLVLHTDFQARVTDRGGNVRIHGDLPLAEPVRGEPVPTDGL